MISHTLLTRIDLSGVLDVSSIPLNVKPISIGFLSDLSLIGNNPVMLTQVLELLKTHGLVLRSLSAVRSSSQEVLFIEPRAKHVISTNVEHSCIMSSEGHTHGSSKDELVVLKTVKTKNKKRVRESARIKGLLESRKKTRKTKNDVGLISTDKALSDTFYDNFHLKKHVVVKTKGMIVENRFAEESLYKIGLIDLLVSGKTVKFSI